jgi:hypothetical protein
MPASFTTTYHSSDEKSWDDEGDLGFKDINKDDYCKERGDYSCGLYEWPGCSTSITSSHMVIENDRDIKMKRDIAPGFSYQVCYKCTH